MHNVEALVLDMSPINIDKTNNEEYSESNISLGEASNKTDKSSTRLWKPLSN